MELQLFGKTWWLWRSKEDGRGLHERISVRQSDAEQSCTFEVHVPSSSCRLSFRCEGLGGERAMSASLCLPPVALYVSLDTPMLQKLSARLIPLLPDPAASKYGDRELSLAIHDNALWWRIWTDSGCWSRARPAWRDGCWHPLGHYKLRGEFEVLEQREVLVPMPERSYRGTAKVLRSRWGFEKLPHAFDKVLTHASVDMHEGEQIPHPGKGENSYDCGEDATFGTHGPGRTVEDGVGSLVASVLRSRYRHGGADWTPKPRAVEASA
ncbi:MAG TPA: hypothetical protein VK524_34575 [Polyangiaceae bacterium]|nr:hypothetical protein [Polyangiaceae bacterium]